MASAAAAPTESQQPADPPPPPDNYSLAAFAHAVEATIDGVAGAIGCVSADLPTALELEGNGGGCQAVGAAAGGGISEEGEGDVCTQQAAGSQQDGGVYSQPLGAVAPPAGAHHEDEFDWEQVRVVAEAWERRAVQHRQ